MVVVLQVLGGLAMIIFCAIGFLTMSGGLLVGAMISVDWFMASLLGLIAMGIGSVCQRLNDLMEQNQFYRDNPIPEGREPKSKDAA